MVEDNLKIDLEKRRPIWIALSNLYLDTELQNLDFKYIASKIKEGPFNFDEVKKIDRNEVFPVLHVNLRGAVGIWQGFQEDRLVETITASLHKKRNNFQKIGLEIRYWSLKSMLTENWSRIEEAYLNEIRNEE